MNQFIVSLKKEVHTLLDELDKNETDILKKAQQGVALLENTIDKMRTFVLDYTFKDEQEEIMFFKDIKPRLSCMLIFYRRVYYIEINRPKGGSEAQADYLKGELDKLTRFFEENKHYYHYLRSGDCSMDTHYFLRGKPSLNIYTENFYYELDASFSTNCDFKMSEILANDLLESHLVIEIDKLEDKDTNTGGYHELPKVKLTWQGSKSDLIEIIYAFDSRKSFGNVTLRQISDYLQSVFNIDLGSNLSRAFAEMKTRNNPCAGLDRLKEALLKRIQKWKPNNRKKK